MNPDRLDAKRYRFGKQHGFPQYSEPCKTPYKDIPGFWFMSAGLVLYKGETFDECIDNARTGKVFVNEYHNRPKWPLRFKENSHQHYLQGWCYGIAMHPSGRPCALLLSDGGHVTHRWLDDVFDLQLMIEDMRQIDGVWTQEKP